MKVMSIRNVRCMAGRKVGRHEARLGGRRLHARLAAGGGQLAGGGDLTRRPCVVGRFGPCHRRQMTIKLRNVSLTR